MRRFLTVSFATLIFSHVAPAQTQLDRFYPPVVGAGNEVTVEAEGKFGEWPLEIDSSREDITIRPTEESGQLSVNVAEDAPPGVAWLRLRSSNAASKLTPLLIDIAAPQTEQEANDTADETAAIAMPATVYGRLERRNDVDMFRVAVTSGNRLVLTCTANHLIQSPMDAVMQLADADGNVLAQSDDVRGLDPQIVYEATEDAELIVRLFAFPETPSSMIGFSGEDAFVYVLQMTTGAYIDHALPLIGPTERLAGGTHFGFNMDAQQRETQREAFGRYDRASTPGAWQPAADGAEVGAASVVLDCDAGVNTPSLELPALCAGHMSGPGETDCYRFSVTAGARYEALVTARDFGFPTDSVIEVVDVKTGEQIARNDDASRSDYDASLTFTAKADSQYELRVSDLVDGFGPQHAYTLQLHETVPAFTLTLANDHFEIEPGKSTEIPVSVSRQHGFDEPIEVFASGPDGLTFCEPVTAEAGGRGPQDIKLKLAHDGETPFSGPIQIIGRHGEGDASVQVAATHALRPHISLNTVWLTAPGRASEREKQ